MGKRGGVFIEELIKENCMILGNMTGEMVKVVMGFLLEKMGWRC